MTLQREPILPERSSRFSLRNPPSSTVGPRTPHASRPGVVDGAWWPRSADLIAELDGLQAMLAERAGAVDRVMYDMDAWRPAPKRTTVAGRSVRLDGYRHRPSHTVSVLGLDRTRLVLMVIPPATDAGTARALLSESARPGPESTAEELMASGDRDRTQNSAALRRWDDEGGHTAPAARRSLAESASAPGGPI